jgi:DNA-directed RNA polymerase subunit F
MSKPEILSEQPINMVDLKEELKRIRKRDNDLTFRGNRTDEYLNQFVTLKPKEVEEMVEKLQKLNIPRLKDNMIHKIVDILPRTEAELKLILQGYTLTVTGENINKIMKVVTNYLPKKR